VELKVCAVLGMCREMLFGLNVAELLYRIFYVHPSHRHYSLSLRCIP
jgi:hypothetical protein